MSNGLTLPTVSDDDPFIDLMASSLAEIYFRDVEKQAPMDVARGVNSCKQMFRGEAKLRYQLSLYVKEAERSHLNTRPSEKRRP
jgi:hypothetical protein